MSNFFCHNVFQKSSAADASVCEIWLKLENLYRICMLENVQLYDCMTYNFDSNLLTYNHVADKC